jgi:hypothetical protein
MQIAEMEEYVGLMRDESEPITDLEDFLGSLRQQKAVIDLRGTEADEQIGAVRQMLDDHGIPEIEAECSSSYQLRLQSPLPFSYIDSDVDSDLDDNSGCSSLSTSVDSTDSDQLSARERVLRDLFQKSSDGRGQL